MLKAGCIVAILGLGVREVVGRLSITPVQRVKGGWVYAFDPKIPLDKDADVTSLHWDFQGVPWDYFLGNSNEIPKKWEETVDEAVKMSKAWNNPVMLSIQALNGPSRGCPADNATIGANGELLPSTYPPGCSGCFDFGSHPELTEAFGAYVEYLVGRFGAELELEAVNYAIEANLYRRSCGSGEVSSRWAGAVEYLSEGYRRAKKALGSGVLVYASLQAEALMGLWGGQACSVHGDAPKCALEEGEAVGVLPQDALGWSSYPFIPAVNNPSAIPWSSFPAKFNASYLAVARSGLPSSFSTLPVLMAETGYTAASLAVNLTPGPTPEESDAQCVTLLNSSAAAAIHWASHLSHLPPDAIQNGTQGLVTWWLDTNLLAPAAMQCPCDATHFPEQCAYLSLLRNVSSPNWMGELTGKLFAAAGVRGNDGTQAQPLYNAVQAMRGRKE